jgi:hypothetical protein
MSQFADWQPIDTAPIGVQVLLYSPNAPGRFDVGIKHEGWKSFEPYGPYTQPTHWMPLPEPPRKDQ